MKTRILLSVLCLFLSEIFVLAGTVETTIRLHPDLPLPTSLSACHDALDVTLDITGMTPGEQITFQGVQGSVISQASLSGTGDFLTSVTDDVTVNGAQLVIAFTTGSRTGKIKFTINLTECELFDATSIQFNTSYPGGTVNQPVLSPPVAIPAIPPVNPVSLAFGLPNHHGDYFLVNDEVKRYYRIAASHGIVDVFSLSITPQPHITIQKIDAVASDKSFKHTLWSTPTTSPVELVFGPGTDNHIDLCSSSGEEYLNAATENYILIEETIKFNDCTGPNESTHYIAGIHCDKDATGTPCKPVSWSLALNCVQRGANLTAYVSDKQDFPPDPTFQNTGPYNGHTGGISVCPDANQNMDYVIFIENVPSTTTLPLPFGAGSKLLHAVNIRINAEYFDFGDIYIGNQNMGHPTGVDDIVGAGATRRLYSIDFTQFTSVDPDGPAGLDHHGGGLSDRVTDSADEDHLITNGGLGDVYNLLPEGEHVKIILKNFRLTDLGRANFKLCDVPLTKSYSTLGSVGIRWEEMCGFNDIDPPVSALQIDNSFTQNRFSGFSSASSDTTDIAPGNSLGQPTGANLTYTFICDSRNNAPDSPFTIAQRPFLAGNVPELMHCPNLKYQAVVTLPPDFLITTDGGYAHGVTITQPRNPSFSGVTVSASQIGSTSDWLIDYSAYSGLQVPDPSGGYISHPAQVALKFNVTKVCNPEGPLFDSVPIHVEFRAVCDDTCPVYRTVGCADVELFFHDCGGCTGTMVGTHNFSLDRVSPGWVDEIAFYNNLVPTAPILPAYANQVYECDVVKAISTDGLADHLPDDGVIAFEIAYSPPTSGSGAENILDLLPGTGKFTFKLSDGTSFWIDALDAASFCTVTDTAHPLPMLRIYGDVSQMIERNGQTKTAQQWLSEDSYTAEFEAQFRIVDDNVTKLTPGKHEIQQFRGQFIVVDESHSCPASDQSCDSWGDALVFWKTVPDITFNQLIGPNGVLGFPEVVDQCYLRYVLSTFVAGPDTVGDTFGSEYRPTLRFADHVRFDIPPGYEFVDLRYAEGANGLGGWQGPLTLGLTDTTSGGAGGYVEISNFRDNYKAYQSIDTINKSSQALKLTLRRLCPGEPVLASAPVTVTYDAITTRAYSPDTVCHENFLPTPQSVIYPGGEPYDIKLTTIPTTDGNINPITIPVTLQHDGWGNSIEKTWIYFKVLSGNATVTVPTRTVDGLTSAEAPPTSTGLYQIGTLVDNHDIRLNVEVSFECVPISGGFKPVEIEIHYGNSCLNYPNLISTAAGFEVGGDPCLHKQDRTITIYPQPSQLSLTAVPDTSCKQITFDVEAKSDLADVRSVSFTALPPAGFTLDTAQSTVESSAGPVQLSTLPALFSGNTWDISDILLHFSQYYFTHDPIYTSTTYNPLKFHLVYVADCSTLSDDYVFGFSMAGTSSCNLPVAAPNANVTVSYSAEPRPSATPSVIITPVEGCTNLLHFSIDLSTIIHQGNLSAHVHATYPPGFGAVLSSSHPITTSSGVADWVIPDVINTSLPITGDLSIPPGFCGDFTMTVVIDLDDDLACCGTHYQVNLTQHICVSPIACSEDKTVPCGSSWTFDPPTQTPGCCIGSNFVVNILSTVTNDSGCSQTFTRTWSAEDSCSNSVICTQIVTVVDTNGPLMNCASNKVVECGTVWSFDPPSAYDLCCTNVTIQLLSSNATVVSLCQTDWQGVWQAMDCCTNVSTCTQTVSVVDTTPPMLNCASNKTVECGSAWSFDPPSAYDLCCSNVTIQLLSSNATVVSLCQTDWQAVWQAMDCCTNVSTCTQTVSVVDTTPPIFTTHCVTNHYEAGNIGDDFVGPEPALPSIGLSMRVPGSKGFDDCTLNQFFAHTFANLPPSITAATLTVRLKPCGDACVTDTFGFYFTDASGNPLPGGWSRLIGSGAGSPPDLVADDWCGHTSGETFTFDLAALPQGGGSLLPLLNQHGFLDIICQDDTAVDYLTLDVVSCSCATNKTVECGSVWSFDEPTASDACCANVAITEFSTITNGTDCLQLITKTWQATDCCSNTATCGQTVTVVDTTAPVLNCASNKTVECTNAWSFDPPSAYDLCCTNVTIQLLSTNATFISPCQTDWQAVWQTTDCCSNSITCTQIVTVVDTTPPVIVCAADKTVACSKQSPGLDWPPYRLPWIFSTNGFDGQNPRGPVIQGSDGSLYGTTVDGGTNGFGTVFKLNPDGTGYTVLRSFNNTDSTGRNPAAGLVEGTDGALYGTTQFRGASGQGAVFKMNKDGSGYTRLHSFNTPDDGEQPLAGLVEGTDGALYGTTFVGGSNGVGTVFKLDQSGSNYMSLKSFSTNGADGQRPWGSVVEGTDGALYGTTRSGGSDGVGTVFKLNKDGTAYAILHEFSITGNDGRNPFSGLVEGTDGALYGTTHDGGIGGNGTVFKLNKDGTGYARLRSFSGTGGDGQNPYSGLVEGADGALYGTTHDGGANTRGTVFKLNQDGTGYAVLHSFSTNGIDGRSPFAGVVEGTDGALYGTTENGGLNGAGAIFRLELPCPWSFDPPTVVNDCCETNVITVLSTVTNGICPTVITRTWRVTDCCSNSVECSQSVTLLDNTPPVITSCPTNRTLFPDFGCIVYVPDMTAEVVASDNSSAVTVVQHPAAGTFFFGTGPHPVVFTVCDACTNCITCTNYVTLDCTPPGPIQINRLDTNVVISWPGHGTLQSSTNLNPPINWTDTTTNSPYTNPTTSGQKFFRLRQ